MDQISLFLGTYAAVVITILVWDIVWKLFAMWRAARKGQTVWFILLGVLNTCGVLPISYLLFSKPSRRSREN